MAAVNTKTLTECLEAIKAMEASCAERFPPRACMNLRAYYRTYCYNRFENKDTCSSDNTFGGTTLNFNIKSPPTPSL